MQWGVGGWLLTLLKKIGQDKADQLRARVADEIKTLLQAGMLTRYHSRVLRRRYAQDLRSAGDWRKVPNQSFDLVISAGRKARSS